MPKPQEEKPQKIVDEIAALANISHTGLRIAWRRLFRAYPPKLLRRNFLEMGVAWKLQEKALGGHNAATKRQSGGSGE